MLLLLELVLLVLLEVLNGGEVTFPPSSLQQLDIQAKSVVVSVLPTKQESELGIRLTMGDTTHTRRMRRIRDGYEADPKSKSLKSSIELSIFPCPPPSSCPPSCPACLPSCPPVLLPVLPACLPACLPPPCRKAGNKREEVWGPIRVGDPLGKLLKMDLVSRQSARCSQLIASHQDLRNGFRGMVSGVYGFRGRFQG